MACAHSQSKGVVASKRGPTATGRVRTKVTTKSSSSFAALADSSDSSSGSSDSETATTVTPSSEVVCDSGDDFTAAELDLGVDWESVERRRKPAKEAKKEEPEGAVVQAVATKKQSCDASNIVDDDDGADFDADWFLRKGQRHGWSKQQKQEWNHKAKLRVDYAKQKREGQRGGMLA